MTGIYFIYTYNMPWRIPEICHVYFRYMTFVYFFYAMYKFWLNHDYLGNKTGCAVWFGMHNLQYIVFRQWGYLVPATSSPGHIKSRHILSAESSTLAWQVDMKFSILPETVPQCPNISSCKIFACSFFYANTITRVCSKTKDGMIKMAASNYLNLGIPGV
jgi:hypothetical protein